MLLQEETGGGSSLGLICLCSLYTCVRRKFEYTGRIPVKFCRVKMEEYISLLKIFSIPSSADTSKTPFTQYRHGILPVENHHGFNRQNKISNNNFCSFVRRSHGTLTVEFRSVLKLLRLALRFHIFSYRYRVNATPKRKNFVPFSNSAGIV